MAEARRGEDFHNLFIHDIEYTVGDIIDMGGGAITMHTVLVCMDEHGTTYRFRFNLDLIEEIPA